MKFNVSDWVHGRTGEGEMVYGFVESMDDLQGLVSLYVVKSDNEERVGRVASVRVSTVKPVPDSSSADSRHVAELIDLALSTHDEAWFMELTEGLDDTVRMEEHRSGSIALKAAPVNRLDVLGR